MFRAIDSNQLITVLLLLCLCFLAIAKLLDTKRFHDFTTLMSNPKYLNIYLREQKFIDLFDSFLFLNFIISLGIFIGFSAQTFAPKFNISANILFKLIAGVGFFILIKILVQRLVGSLFEMDKLIDHYLFQKTSFNHFLGLILLPVNLLLTYSLIPSPVVIYVIGGCLALIVISGLLSSIKANQGIIKNNLFYFILYLCTLEIAPYIILCQQATKL